MSLFNTYPPIRLHGPGTRVSQANAQKFVAGYLNRATDNPALHPDSLLTDSGPQFATLGTEGLVITSLRRFEAGLRGEHQAAEAEDKKGSLGFGVTTELVSSEHDTNSAINGAARKRKRSEAEEGDAGVGMWQDKEEFEREQEDVEGEVGPRTQKTVEARPGRSVMPRMQNDVAKKAPADREEELLDRRTKKKKQSKAERLSDGKEHDRVTITREDTIEEKVRKTEKDKSERKMKKKERLKEGKKEREKMRGVAKETS